MNFLRKIISALDMDYTCEQVYTAVATGAGVTLFTSLIPGASGVSNIATKVKFEFSEKKQDFGWIYLTPKINLFSVSQ